MSRVASLLLAVAVLGGCRPLQVWTGALTPGRLTFHGPLFPGGSVEGTADLGVAGGIKCPDGCIREYVLPEAISCEDMPPGTACAFAPAADPGGRSWSFVLTAEAHVEPGVHEGTMVSRFDGEPRDFSGFPFEVTARP